MRKSNTDPQLRKDRIIATKENAIKIITENKVIFIEDLCILLGISKTAFYDYFKLKSDDYNELKALIDKNKVEIKSSMRNKWYKSTAPALQLALYKLICSEDERKMLQMSYTENKTEVNGEFNIKDVLSFED